MDREKLNKLSSLIVDCAYHVHKEMGPGLLECVYEYCMIEELKRRNIFFQSQFIVPLFYKGVELTKDFRIDILIENEIVVELKSVDVLLPVHEAQLISYLKLTKKKLGLLINFNVPYIKQGILRRVNNF